MQEKTLGTKNFLQGLGNFQARLEAVMREKQISQSELARLVKTRQSTVQGWLSGSVPRPRTMAEIAEAINVSEEWLSNGNGDPDRSVSLKVREDPVPYGNVSQFLELPEKIPAGSPSLAELNIVMVDAVLGLLDAAVDKIEAGELPDSTLKTARQMIDIVKAQWPGAADALKESKS